MWAALLSLLLPAGSLADPPVRPGQVLVVGSSRAPAYQEAIEGIGSALSDAGVAFRVLTLDASGNPDQVGALLGARPVAVVAVGSPALEVIRASQPDLPVLATMVLGAVGAGRQPREPVVTLTLEVPAGVVLARLRTLYPKRNRIAVVRGPALASSTVAEIRSEARKHGFAIEVIDAPGPKDLLDRLATLRDRADFLWCFPDSALYQGPLVPALVLAAIRNRLPLIGFSEGMVRAGALVGFYPDYHDVGLQTGEALVRRLAGTALASYQHPRKVNWAVNERVTRVLGLPWAANAAPELLVVR